MSKRRRRLLAGCSLALLLASPLHAAGLDARLARAVRQVVEAQLRAMADGDDVRAFSYAAPAIRAQFGDAARFMAMVQGRYPMVVRPAAKVFYQPTQEDDGTVLQVVQLRDADGRRWRAAYLLARQAGGAWRIAGCVVTPDTASGSV